MLPLWLHVTSSLQQHEFWAASLVSCSLISRRNLLQYSGRDSKSSHLASVFPAIRATCPNSERHHFSDVENCKYDPRKLVSSGDRVVLLFLQMVFVSQSASRVLRRPDGSIPASYLPPPPRSKLPMILLSKDPHFACLFHLLRQLSSFCPSNVSAVRISSFL